MMTQDYLRADAGREESCSGMWMPEAIIASMVCRSSVFGSVGFNACYIGRW
jgi:hypothetical protein